MEESTKTDVSSRRVKRLQSDTSLNKSSSLKSGEESIQVISNGTGSSSTENLVEEESSSRATKGSIRITKISKNSKTEPSKEAIKSPNKAVLSPVKATSPSSSPSSSSVSKDDFQGFEDINLGKKEGERRKEFLSFVENLTSEEWVEPEDDNKDEASERGEEEEEMTVDASQTSDTDSNQMEIDTGSDKAQDKTRDSDVDALEMDVVEEEQPTKNGVSGNGNNTRPKGGGAKVEYYCGACEAEVNDSEEAICCDGTCERWFHLRCSGLSQSEYNELGLDENAKWACSKCSGKPTPVTPAVTKPLLSVRKDLAKPIVTPASTKRKSVAKEGSAARGARIDISNPAFLKPFDFGWKRELVYRSTSDNTPSSKRHGDIYYYTPKGKKLRSLREILDHLAGTDLTQDNFTFHKEPIGLDDPDKEIIRDAKLKMAMRDPLSTPSPAVIKKATPKITKAPKQATPKVVPKLTATVSPLETGGTTVLKASASVTPRVVFKGKASMGGTVRTKITPKTQASTSQAQKDKKKKTNDDDLEMGMLPPMWEPVPKQKESNSPAVVGSKRQLESPEEAPAAKRVRAEKPAAPPGPTISPFFLQNMNEMSNSLVHAFRYLKVQELLRASRVCVNWQRLAFDRSLWETVRMKNSQVRDWEGFAATLNRTGTKHLDLRKILINEKADIGVFWGDCIKALGKVHSLLKLDLCRCTPGLVEQITAACPQLESITATTIKNGSVVNLKNLGMNLTELKLKAQGSMTVSNWSVLENLTKLKQLSITTVKNLDEVLPVIGKMTQLDALELGEMTNISESSVVQGFSALTKLKRLRLEKGQDNCPTDKIMEVISQLPLLVQLELINFDVKGRFSDSLALCTNIKILLIIPTYVTQSATTNHLVINGIGKLNQTLNHFIWGLTLELLRVTDLFIDQWELRQKTPASKTPSQPAKKICGDSIPVLKLTGGTETKDGKKGKDVTQVDVLQLPKLHKVLTSLLPTTKIILLKVPFSATWRQTISSTLQ